MMQVLAIIFSFGSFLLAFLEPIWAWVLLSCAATLLLIIWGAVKPMKFLDVDELTPAANEMLRKYGFFYTRPFASLDIKKALHFIQFGALAVGIVSALHGLLWAFGFVVIFWVILGLAAMSLNPMNFLQRNPEYISAHEEIIAWTRGETKTEKIDTNSVTDPSAHTEDVLHFKNTELAFEFMCEFERNEVSQNVGIPAIVLDAKKLFNAEAPVPIDEDGVQRAYLRVASGDGGFEVVGHALSRNGPSLGVGDLVIWVPLKHVHELAKQFKDDRAGWVGTIVARLHPRRSVKEGWAVDERFRA